MTEFGSASNNLGGYYIGSTTRTRGVPGIPASGTISMSSFQNKGAPKFAVSPAVSGVTTWHLIDNGDLSLTSAGDWTITLSNGPVYAFGKLWGGAGGTCYSLGTGSPPEVSGGGGYAYGNLTLANSTA